jgi:polyisoprenoid-binding protein YceI
MKLTTIVFGIAATAALFSCGDKNTEKTATDTTAAEVSYTVDPAASSIRWEGNMTGVKVYNHFGSINLKEGSFSVKGTSLVTGSFVVDMKSINPTDSNYSAEHPKEHLVGHLGNNDFFLVDSFPTATFVIKSVEGNTATGDFTLKGITNSEKVTDIVIDTTGGMVKATGKLEFDRQKYKAAFKMAVKDMVLADAIKLDISLVGAKK